MTQRAHIHPSFAIGGVGGSGTRILAGILRDDGVNMGGDLNESLDNLWFTLLFKHLPILTSSDDSVAGLLGLFGSAMAGPRDEPMADHAGVELLRLTGSRPQHGEEWLQLRLLSLVQALRKEAPDLPWGWKEPNTHVVLPALMRLFPDLVYVHVVRNGLDMALSRNQNQPLLWGPAFVGRPWETTAEYSFSYWCEVHRRLRNFRGRTGAAIHTLRYEDLCSAPRQTLEALFDALGRTPSSAALDAYAARVAAPSGVIGRSRDLDLSCFGEADLDELGAWGYQS